MMFGYVRITLIVLFAAGIILCCNNWASADLFMSDVLHTIYRFTPDGTQSVFATGLNDPVGLAFDESGNLFECDSSSHNIYKFAPNGTRSTFGNLSNHPETLAFDKNGTLFVNDLSGSIFKFTPEGAQSSYAIGQGSPGALAFDSRGNLFEGETFGGRIFKYAPDGTRVTFVTGLRFPYGLAFDKDDNLFVADSLSIIKITPSGVQTTFSTGLSQPGAIAFDNSGNLFVDDASKKIYKFTPDGTRSIFASNIGSPGWLAFSPIPEPSTLALLGIGGVGLIACGWRRRKAQRIVVCFIALLCSTAGMAWADTFGTGANQFTLDFVPISGATNPTSGYGIVNLDYRMGTYAISNDQWNKFTASLGVPVRGYPLNAYGGNFYDWGTGTMNVPVNTISWYAAAQFVNWLNTSTGHQAAYKFTGTQGTNDYTFATWSAAEAAGGTNLYRNKDAYYFLPTENEWVKAAYWNGTSLQQYATKPGDSLFQGNGTTGGWNYWNNGYATNPHGPWAVTSGSQELNGTYNMMGNIWQWTESPYGDTTYGASSSRSLRGGSFVSSSSDLASSCRYNNYFPYGGDGTVGFRVASVPEPGSIMLLLTASLGGLLWWRRR